MLFIQTALKRFSGRNIHCINNIQCIVYIVKCHQLKSSYLLLIYFISLTSSFFKNILNSDGTELVIFGKHEIIQPS